MWIGDGTVNSIPTRRNWRAIALACMFLWAYASQSQTLPANDVEPRISVRISTKRSHFQPGEDIRLQVEIWNESKQDLFVSKNIENLFSNALAKIDLTVYHGNQPVGPLFTASGDSFSGVRSTYPPLTSELPRYWIALSPQHFYGGELTISASSFKKPVVPGRYRIQGKYSSRGFLAQDINNPLAHYAEELKLLPYEAWVGQVETNSVWIEITNKP